MSRTITLTDDQAGNLLSLVRREYFAPCALDRDRIKCAELYQILTMAPHTPDTGREISPCELQTLKREENLRDLISAASWVVKLFGTHDAVGQRELREEVTKLRIALRAYRRADQPLALTAEG